jgi:membrane associated rhomboid family serine protease
MFPLKDDNPTKSFPYVTILFIIINVVVFILQVTTRAGGEGITAGLAVVPARFFSDISATGNGSSDLMINPFFTLVTYSFLHGGIGHLAFNLLFLWIFGNNIEDALGRIKFILFYIICGIAAAFLHTIFHMDSSIPMVGASGSIAGILGAYLILYPHAHIHTLFIFIFIIRIIKVPAVFFMF